MSPSEISLLAVTVAFTGLVIWVYWPSRRRRLESFGSIPLDDEASPDATAADADPLQNRADATNPEKNYPDKKREERL